VALAVSCKPRLLVHVMHRGFLGRCWALLLWIVMRMEGVGRGQFGLRSLKAVVVGNHMPHGLGCGGGCK
jgi:hypothetical protein